MIGKFLTISSGNLEYVVDGTAQDGLVYVRHSGKTGSQGLAHQIPVTQHLLDQDFEFSYYMRNPVGGYNFVRTSWYVETTTRTYSHICGSGCIYANGEWVKMHKRCNIAEILENGETLNDIVSVEMRITVPEANRFVRNSNIPKNAYHKYHIHVVICKSKYFILV